MEDLAFFIIIFEESNQRSSNKSFFFKDCSFSLIRKVLFFLLVLVFISFSFSFSIIGIDFILIKLSYFLNLIMQSH